MSKFRTISFNCNGLGGDIKRRQVFNFLRGKNADFFLLQETHCTNSIEKIWETEWGGKAFFSNGTSNSTGVCILIKKDLDFKLHGMKRDNEGRILCLDIEIDDCRFSLCNLYAPNLDSPDFFENCLNLVDEFDNISKIIAGDFNLVLDLDLDKKGGAPVTHFNARDTLKSYMENNDIIDIWRLQHPDARVFTWKRSKPPIFCRLDMILISEDLMGDIENTGILPGYRSDHSLVMIDYNSTSQSRGKGFWKLNTSLLSDKDYVELINNCIDDAKITYKDENPAIKLEMVKIEVAGTSIKYSKNKAKSKRNIMDALEKKISRLEKNLADASEPYKIEKIHKDLESTNVEHQKLVHEKTKSAMFRCRARWFEYGEKSSKYFFNLEKANHNKKTMKATYLSDGTLTRNPEKILHEQSSFYQKLFTSDENVEFNIPNNNNPKISDRESFLIDKDIDIDDLKYALRDMPNNKTPGCDGLPVEFYKVFWVKIQDVLLEALLYAHDMGKLHISARRGIISLIPKKYKDINFIKNWRPLTLLNCDYKILAKALAKRLKLSLEKLINRDQSGFLRGRFIGENIRLILDTLDFAEDEDIPALLISIDYEKCFDRLEWSAVSGALRYFNFGENFINWVKVLYNDIESCTCNNGHASEWFKPTRGLRQGCPLSPYLFLTCAEIFANLIRNNKDIKGIKINDLEIKLSQYADDTNIFTLFDANSLDAIISTFDYVHKNTGLKVNYDKTAIYRIGSLRHSDAILYTQKNFKWVNHPVTVLGVNVTHEKTDLLKLNYDDIFTSLEKTVEMWGNRKLSLAGKIITANTLMSSQFIYKLVCLESPSTAHYERYKKIIRNYIWEGKTAKIAYETLVAPPKDGGFKLIDLQKKDQALKIQWIRRLEKNEKLAALAYNFLPNVGTLIWQCNLHAKHVIHFMPKRGFWYDVLSSWCAYNFCSKTTINDIINEIVWFNSEITVNGKPIVSRKCIDKNILYVGDFLNNNNEFMSYEEFNNKHNNVLNFLEYYGIITAIPASMKNVIRTELYDGNVPESNYSKMIQKSLSSQYYYNEFIANGKILEKVTNRWENTFDLPMNTKDFSKLFVEIKVITLSTKHRSFLYTLLHQATVTNVRLLEWKMHTTGNCTFCDVHQETLLHLFWECPTAKHLWNSVMQWYNGKTNQNVHLNSKKVLLCKPVSNALHCLNTIVLVTLQYIYASRCLGNIPNFGQLKAKIMDIQNIEKYIAVKNDKMKKHENKWKGF